MTRKVIDLSCHRISRARGFRPRLDPPQLLSEKILDGHLSAAQLGEGPEMLGRDGSALGPVRDPALSDAAARGDLALPARDLDNLCNSAHSCQISGAITGRQERRYWESALDSISVPNMGSETEAKRAKPTAADLAAATRLRAIRERTLAERRPTQQQIADKLDVSQGAVSHYFTGRMRLTFNAVVLFAELYGCRPEEIRNDLPEMQAAKSFVAASTPSENAAEFELDAIWSSYTIEQKRTLIGMGRLASGMAPAATKSKAHHSRKQG